MTSPTLLRSTRFAEVRRVSAPSYKWWNPSLLIVAVLLLTIFEGAFRKWLFAADPVLRYGTYFSKDIVFVLAAYVGLTRNVSFDLSWLAVCAALILLPSAGATMIVLFSSPVGVLLSLRAYLLVPACAYLSAPLIQDFRDIRRCAIVVAAAAIPVAVLSTYQYGLPATHPLNRYDSSTEGSHVVAVADHVRATGTFAYISGMAMMAGTSAWAGTFLLLSRSNSAMLRVLGAGALLAGLVCSATAMSRLGLVLWLVTCISGTALYLRPKHVFLLLVTLAAGRILLAGTPPDASDLTESAPLFHGLEHRLETADAFSERAMYILMNLSLGLRTHPLGDGLGVGQSGGLYVSTGDVGGWRYESEWGRIAYEVGVLGLIGVLSVRARTLVHCWRRFSHIQDDRDRLVLATALPLFAMLSMGWMAFNHTGNSFAWAIITLGLAVTARRPCREATRVLHVPTI